MASGPVREHCFNTEQLHLIWDEITGGVLNNYVTFELLYNIWGIRVKDAECKETRQILFAKILQKYFFLSLDKYEVLCVSLDHKIRLKYKKAMGCSKLETVQGEWRFFKPLYVSFHIEKEIMQIWFGFLT